MVFSSAPQRTQFDQSRNALNLKKSIAKTNDRTNSLEVAVCHGLAFLPGNESAEGSNERLVKHAFPNLEEFYNNQVADLTQRAMLRSQSV